MNRAKNNFVNWLKEQKAEDIDIYEGEKSNEWDYYRAVSAFIGNNLYTVYFMIWKGKESIDYSDEWNRYRNMTIDEFKELII